MDPLSSVSSRRGAGALEAITPPEGPDGPDNDVAASALLELPPADPYAHAKRVEPRIDVPVLEPFVGFTVEPTGVRVVDTIIDVIVKIALSPLLLLCGLIDLSGAGVFDRLVRTAFLRRMEEHGDAFVAALAYYRHKSSSQVSERFARLARAGELTALLERLDPARRRRVEALMVSRLVGGASAAWIIERLIVHGPLWEPLVDRLLHRLYAVGGLQETIALVRAMRPRDARLADLEERASDIPRPLVIGHRGAPGNHMENSLASLQAAMDAGADGVEIDLCLTQDGHVVVWHDDDPDSVVALMRQAGLEPGQAYHPIVPPLGDPLRRPVHTLTYAQWRGTHGFQHNTPAGMLSRTPRGRIPEVSEVAKWAASQSSRLRLLCLDTKLPPDASDRMLRAYADGIKRAFGPLAQRCLIMSPYKHVVAGLRRYLGEAGFRFTFDTEIVSATPQPTAVRGLHEGIMMGNDTISVGMPRVGIDGEETFNEVVYDLPVELTTEHRPDVVLWTLNSKAQWRDALGAGVANAVLTDDVGGLRRLVDKLCPRRSGDNPLHPPARQALLPPP